MATCQYCGGELNAGKKYCSHRCYSLAKAGKPSANSTKVARVCATCGHTFFATPRTIEAGGAKYCSTKCFHHSGAKVGAPQKRVTKTCQQCGHEYEVIRSWGETSKYCSRECKHAHQRTVRGHDHPLKNSVEMSCEYCGRAFERKPSQVARSRFCSRQCHGAWRVQNTHSPTSIELIIAGLLKELHIPFQQERQMGSFLCDFVVSSAKLVIECDGSYWHSSPIQKLKDSRKDSWLTAHGYAVLRLDEREIRNDLPSCRKKILANLG